MNERVIQLVAFLYKKKVTVAELEEALREYLHDTSITFPEHSTIQERVLKSIKEQMSPINEMIEIKLIKEILENTNPADIDAAIDFLVKKGLIYKPRHGFVKTCGGN